MHMLSKHEEASHSHRQISTVLEQDCFIPHILSLLPSCNFDQPHNQDPDSFTWSSKDTALKFQTQAKTKQTTYSSWSTGKWFPAESADVQFKTKVTIKI